MTTIFNEQIYDPAFPLDGPHLVAASAGTGKTYNIQNVCARLVMERNLRIPEIQVTTFTDAATKELRDRVRKVFANLSLLFAGREDEILDRDGRKDVREVKRLERLRECARGNGVPDLVARSRVEGALREFDLAAITTIHGFCSRAMKRFAFETGAAFQAELRDDKTADLRRRTRDWWRTRRRGGGDGFPALEDLQDAVVALGGKTAWTMDGADATLAGAKEIVERYEADRPTRETQTFDDLLRAVRDALRDKTFGPVLAGCLRRDLKAVVVDEFQDTDPAQYEIFSRVFLDVPAGTPQPPLFFVGDPKQAIYSFRGADIYTYRNAAERTDVKANASRLDKNFRATPRLVDAVNALFRDPGDGSFTFGDQTIDYPEDLKAATDPDERIPGLLVGGGEDPHPFRVVEFRGNAKDVLRLAVADAVVGVLNEQKDVLTPKDVAILVSSHKAGRTFRDELRRRGVPAVLQKAGNVFAGDTAKDFRKVLLAMAGIGGRRQIRAALATPFFDFASGTGFPGEDDAVFADMVGAFAKWNGDWRKKGFAAAFAELESHERCRLRPRFAKMADGERRLADILQIVDLAGAAVRERGPAPEVLVDWLTERINLAGDEKADKQWGRKNDRSKAPEADSDEYARELESESDAVKIMTLHVSKGLEFPVTVVPVGSAFSVSSPYFHHDGDGKLHVSADPADADAAQAEEDAEHMRKLYVSFTRATKRTIVVTPPPAEGSSLARLLGNAARRGSGPDGSPILRTEWQPAPDGQPAAYAAEKPPLDRLSDAETPRGYGCFFQPVKGSYSSLIPKDNGKEGDADDEPKPDGESEEDDESREDLEFYGDPSAGELDRDAEGADDSNGRPEPPSTDGEEENPIFGFRGGDKIGTCWHDIFETISFDADDAGIQETTRRLLRLHGLAARDPDSFEKDVGIVAGMVRATLDRPLASPAGDTFFLHDVGWSDRFSEWEFHFPSRTAKESSMAAIAQILREEWAGEKDKEPFLAAAAAWRRPIPKGFLKGYLDLLFRHDGLYYVVDWKSNRLDGHADDFTEEGVRAEMAKHHYFLQYLLYSAVLHRFLKETMGADYSWENNFGGIRYVFLRGVAAGAEAAVFSDRPPARLLDRIGNALGLEDRT